VQRDDWSDRPSRPGRADDGEHRAWSRHTQPSRREPAAVAAQRRIAGLRPARFAQLTVVVAIAVGLALVFGLSGQNKNLTLAASSDNGGPLFGTTANTLTALAQNTREFGHQAMVRTRYLGLPPANVWTSGPDGTNDSAAIVSFNVLPSKILSGADNAALTRFFDNAPRNRTIYYSYYAEPEALITAHRFTMAQYQAAWKLIAAKAKAAHNPDLKSTLILRASDLASGSGINWKSYLPAGSIISVLSWDAYPAGTLPTRNPQATAPAQFLGPAVAAAKSVHLPYGIAGFALATATGRARWLEEVANYLMTNKALFGVLAPAVAKTTELNDKASVAAWTAVVARSGTDDLFTFGQSPPPTPQPTPSSSTTTPAPQQSSPPTTTPPSSATPICGQSILNSPYDYDGAAGSYSSGTAGLPTYGAPGTDFPQATAGDVVAADSSAKDFMSYQLNPDTVYFLLPGTHIGSFQADAGDAFVGGYSGGQGAILSGNNSQNEGWAIDSNSSMGNQTGVTIEYLTIEKYTPNGNAGAINQDTNTGWTIQYNTVTLNVPGAGIMAGSDNVIKDNCLTLNGQYGFQSTDANSWGVDTLTGGPYNVTVEGNEISYNDTCDFAGTIDNSAVGWNNYNPVPSQYRPTNCGQVDPDGDNGGFKLWQTDGVTIKDNYIHNNWGPGAWVDTGNANTTFTGNTFTDNEGQAIIEEISYNFAITGNYMADNDWTDGLGNNSFPQTAVYIASSGSDTSVGAVPGCPESSCSGQASYPRTSYITNNTLVDNGGNIFLFQDSNRYCSDSQDGMCTLVDGGPSGPFTMSACATNLKSASLSSSTFAGNMTGSPKEDWWDGCQWQAANVSITGNTIDFNPANITVNGQNVCNQTAWPDCGAGGVFSEYGAPPGGQPDWAVATELTFFQNDVWANNTYNGPSTFYAWNQGNNDTITWGDWTGSLSAGDKCTSSGEEQSGACTGPFGQDAGSTFNPAPVTTNPTG
jgi:parallel beta-helix repeat protein